MSVVTYEKDAPFWYDQFDEPEDAPEQVEPTIDTPAHNLERADLTERYTDGLRGPNDFVVSGPLPKGWGPGRFMRSYLAAVRWARAKYGKERVLFIRQSVGRWCFLIKEAKNVA
jgi:hypothetical protein